MLYLIFQSGEEKYACLCNRITEIIPLVEIKKSPHIPEFFSGFINYGGQQVPVIDWSQFMLNRPSRRFMHTRVILFDMREGESEEGPTMGLIAERVTQTRQIHPEKFITCGVELKEISYLKGVNNDAEGTIQLVDIPELYNHTKDIIVREYHG